MSMEYFVLVGLGLYIFKLSGRGEGAVAVKMMKKKKMRKTLILKKGFKMHCFNSDILLYV